MNFYEVKKLFIYLNFLHNRPTVLRKHERVVVAEQSFNQSAASQQQPAKRPNAPDVSAGAHALLVRATFAAFAPRQLLRCPPVCCFVYILFLYLSFLNNKFNCLIIKDYFFWFEILCVIFLYSRF